MQSGKATFSANSDVALVKYWGKKDDVLRLPENGSVSMTLGALQTITTVEFREDLTRDIVVIAGESDELESARVSEQLDRIRERMATRRFARVASENTFPRGTGLSSSGSGFAALTCAAAAAADLSLTKQELSILARRASGTACRCVCGGYVEWKDGETSETSYAETIFPAEYWDLRDVIVVVDEGRKRVSSTEGHKTAGSSPFFPVRQTHIGKKIVAVKEAIGQRDFSRLGDLIEAEALEFHTILLTSAPPLIAWYPGTVQVMLEVQQMRRERLPAYFTINTGFNIHVLTLPEYETKVQARLNALSLVKSTMLSGVGQEPGPADNHLF